jgi:hypothetical protein
MHFGSFSSQSEKYPNDLVKSETIRIQQDKRGAGRDLSDTPVNVIRADGFHAHRTEGLDHVIADRGFRSYDQGTSCVASGFVHCLALKQFGCQ